MATILVVDDKELNRSVLNALLSHQGHRIVEDDAISAISMARKENPDLIVLDLGLPAGDGFQVMERLKSFPELMLVPVIVVTARDPKMNEELALQADAYAFFQKPYEPGELHQAIQNELFSPSVYKDS